MFKWSLLLLVAAALVVGGYLYLRLDDEIRRQVEHRLAVHYGDLDVHVGRARYEQDRGIAIYDVSVLEPRRDSTPEPLVSIEEMYLAGKIRMEELLSGQPNIERVIIRRARLRAARELDGRWNVQALVPLPQLSDRCPTLVIEDASVVLEDAARTPSAPFTIRDVDLTLTPIEPTGNSSPAGRRYRVLGTVTGLPSDEFTFQGEIGTTDGSLNLTVTMRSLTVTPELLAAVPMFPSAMEAEFSGRADVTLHLNRPAANEALNWSATLAMDRGRIAHARLPEPLTDVALTAKADRDRLMIERLTGKFGPASVTFACERAGWSKNAPLALAARIAGLPIDERVKSALPESCARIWQRFQPTGVVHAEARLRFDGERWSPQISGELRGASLTDAEKFPYPLKQATGSFQYIAANGTDADRLQFDLTAQGGGRPVRIAADLTHVAPRENDGETVATGVASTPPSRDGASHGAGYRGRFDPGTRPHHPLGWIELSGADIPLHEELIAALPEKGEQLVRSLRPQGLIDFHFRAEWTDLKQPRADVRQEIRLKDCTIQYERFPYTLHYVHGVLREQNRVWTLHDIEARGGSDSAQVVCRGHTTPLGQGCRAALTFDATNVPLDDNLKFALPPEAQRAWDELQPQGRVNFVANVQHETGEPKPAITVALTPHERSVSIQPLKFPYRLEQVDGRASFQAGRVELSNLSGQHGRTAFSAASGTWHAMPDGGWQMLFKGFNADRLTPHRDRDFLLALPPAMQNIAERLQPTGTFAVYNSNLSFAKSPQSARLAAAWDISIDCHQAALHAGLPIQSMTGGMRFIGRSDGHSSHTAAELALDSLVCKDTQFTNIRGPLWIDPTYCLLGEPAGERSGHAPRRVTADAYGGSLAGNAIIQHAGNPGYKLDVALGGANLARFANERLGGPRELGGTVSGKLLLSGTGRSAQNLSGSGELHVVDANIYELPVLVALLKVLKSRTPNTSAFNRCDMQFDIRGEYIHFQHLNLLGDAYSLYGRGETNLRRELDLVFYTLIGPADLPIPLWKTIAGQVSQQGLQLKVVGNWDDPDVQRKALPAVNDVLQHIQTEIQAGAATMSPSTAARDAVATPR